MKGQQATGGFALLGQTEAVFQQHFSAVVRAGQATFD